MGRYSLDSAPRLHERQIVRRQLVVQSTVQAVHDGLRIFDVRQTQRVSEFMCQQTDEYRLVIELINVDLIEIRTGFIFTFLKFTAVDQFVTVEINDLLIERFGEPDSKP